MNFTCLTRPALSLAALLLVVSALPPSLAAQATSPYSKTLDAYVYGGYTDSAPDYGPFRNTGVALGGNVSRQFHFLPFTPSLEARIAFTNGPAVKQSTYLGGLHIERTFVHHLHPYGNFLVGLGELSFNFKNPNGYQGDNSIVKGFGGGLDADVTDNFRVKADLQYQMWTLGINNSLTPTVLLFGVTYHIPFRPLTDRQVLR
jgi:hypothetical protein